MNQLNQKLYIFFSSSHLLKFLSFLCVSVPLWLIILFSAAHAGGPVQGAKSTAMGTAFVAVADDPSAMAVNPAGLTQMNGTNTYGGVTFVIPSTTYESPSGDTEKTDFQVFIPPHFYIASDADSQNLRLGLGIFSLYGIGGRKWDEDGLTRYLSTKSQIATMSVNPTVAYRLLPSLSIGAGIDYMYSLCEAEKMVDQSALGAGDGRMSLKNRGDGWGYNFGILFAPDRKIKIGAAYRSRIRIDYEGELEIKHIAPALQPLFGGSDFETDTSSTYTFPDIISFGIAYMPTEKLTLALDAEQARWSTFKRADLDIDEEIPEAGLVDSSSSLDWKDSWLYKIGVEYKVDAALALRAGYVFVESPVPDDTLDPSNPDSDMHNINIGFGYTIDKIIIDFFYDAGFYEDREVDNDILDGEYRNFIHYTGVSVGYSF